ncbi:molybdenum cofactor biosynthesis enzyme [Eggerthella sp. YY7918]|nr:molybdenum cofactor biosynthesis enzyme [Eggerthella sp. YY7918]
MSLDVAKQCIEFAQRCGVSRVVLIGGEPTLHSEILSVIDLIHSYGMKIALVTNGVCFGVEKHGSKILERLDYDDSINVSIKGVSRNEYGALCSDLGAFDRVVKGLSILGAITAPRTSISYVVSENNIEVLEETLLSIREMTDLPLGLSFCGPCFDKDGFEGKMSIQDRSELVNMCLNVLGNTSVKDISLHLNLSMCKVNAFELGKALERCNIHTGCHVLNNSGIVFDTNGDLLLCNHLVGMPIGRFGEDYRTADSFQNYLDSQAYSDAWSAFTRLPFNDCEGCDSLLICGGGCPLHFF